MSGHHITQCRECGDVLSQCRCPGPHETRLVVCDKCKAKPKLTPEQVAENREGGMRCDCTCCRDTEQCTFTDALFWTLDAIATGRYTAAEMVALAKAALGQGGGK